MCDVCVCVCVCDVFIYVHGVCVFSAIVIFPPIGNKISLSPRGIHFVMFDGSTSAVSEVEDIPEPLMGYYRHADQVTDGVWSGWRDVGGGCT